MWKSRNERAWIPPADFALCLLIAEHFEKSKRQNRLRDEDIAEIVDTHQFRKEEECCARRVAMPEVAENAYNRNLTRCVSCGPAAIGT